MRVHDRVDETVRGLSPRGVLVLSAPLPERPQGSEMSSGARGADRAVTVPSSNKPSYTLPPDSCRSRAACAESSAALASRTASRRFAAASLVMRFASSGS